MLQLYSFSKNSEKASVSFTSKKEDGKRMLVLYLSLRIVHLLLGGIDLFCLTDSVSHRLFNLPRKIYGQYVVPYRCYRMFLHRRK